MTLPGRPPRGPADVPDRSAASTAAAAEAVIHESPEALREIVDRAAAVIYVKDLAGRYLLVNRRLEELFAVDRNAYVGHEDLELHPREIAERLRENDRKVLAKGRAHEFEEVVVAVDGEPRTYISLKFPLRDAAGEVYALCGMSTDITDRKRIEEALRESEERFRTLADSLPVLVWLSGPDKAGVWFNKTWLEFTGRSLDDELGEGWVDSVHPGDRGALGDRLIAFEERRPFTTQFRLRRHDGTWRWMLDVGQPRFTKLGSFLGYVGSAFDVTEQLDLEHALRETAAELAEADRRKDEFLAMLGHELRNPLAPIRNALELVRPAVEGAGETAGRGLAVIDRQLRQLTRLVDDLLDVGRIRNGEIRLRRERVELAAVVESAVETVGPLAAERRQPIEVELPERPVLLDADPARLAQVVANLLHNAAKYSPSGRPIELRASVAGGTVTIRVRDRGEGIDPAALPGIFELFYRGHQGDDARHSGLGVGLSLVKSLVELHGGRVEAASDGPGRGSEMSVHLPCVERADEAESPAPGASAETKTPPEPLREAPPEAVGEAPEPARPQLRPCRRVLVVDDNRDTAETLALLLGGRGHDVATAHDGPSAVETAGRHLPEVILLDVGLPGFDGYEVARRLRADARFDGAVLVAVTGYGLDDDRRRAEEAGFHHHLLKPVDFERLETLLAKSL